MFDRKSIEQHIIEASEAVDILQREWFNSEEYNTFYWQFSGLLKGYYRTHEDDDQISLAVVSEYLDFMRMLTKLLLDDKSLSPALRERVREELEALDSAMQEIFRYGIHYDD